VVEQLKIRLLGTAPAMQTTDPETYSRFLQGRAVSRRFNAEAFEQAIALYKEALSTDPTYAPAWDGLAEIYFNQMDLGILSPDQGLPLAHAALDRALSSDPGYAPAYARLALVDGLVAMNLAAAAGHIEKGLAIAPANLDVIGAASMIARVLRRYDQAIALAQYVVSRDPVSAQGHDRLAMIYHTAGRFEEALEEFRTVLKLSPGFASEHHYIGRILLLRGRPEAALAEIQQEPAEAWRLIGLVMAYHALGRSSDSDTALEELVRKYGEILPWDIAYALAYRGEVDRVFALLSTVDSRNIGVGIMSYHSMLEHLHSDERWLPFLRKQGMAPEQLAAIEFDVKLPE
jgi:tetratricopeptide (TPR) repeat protein